MEKTLTVQSSWKKDGYDEQLLKHRLECTKVENGPWSGRHVRGCNLHTKVDPSAAKSGPRLRTKDQAGHISKKTSKTIPVSLSKLKNNTMKRLKCSWGRRIWNGNRDNWVIRVTNWRQDLGNTIIWVRTQEKVQQVPTIGSTIRNMSRGWDDLSKIFTANEIHDLFTVFSRQSFPWNCPELNISRQNDLSCRFHGKVSHSGSPNRCSCTKCSVLAFFVILTLVSSVTFYLGLNKKVRFCFINIRLCVIYVLYSAGISI